MQESDENKTYNRASDFTDGGKEPNIRDVWQHAGLAHIRINELRIEQNLLKRAFLKDDLDTPDYDGHRRSHKTIETSQKVVQDYKVSMTKDVIKIVVGFVFGLLIYSITAYIKNL